MIRFLLRTALTILLVWLLAMLLPQYVLVKGGIPAFVILGLLLELLNMLVRPILNIITFPLKLFATLLAIVLANVIFLWILTFLVSHINPALVSLHILGGVMGWIVVALVIGLGNWVVKELV